MTNRRNSSEYQPSPPIVRLPGRGRAAAGLNAGIRAVVGQLDRVEEVVEAGWKLAFKITGTPEEETYEDETVTLPCTGEISEILVNFTGTWDVDATGFESSVGGGGNSFIQIGIIEAVPNYILGMPLRLIMEVESIEGLEESGSFVGIAYQNQSEEGPPSLASAQNAINSEEDLTRWFGGISNSTSGDLVTSTGTTIESPDAVLALYVALPGQQAYYAVEPFEGDVDWEQLSAEGSLYAIEGDQLLPDGPGTSFNSGSDTMSVAIVNAEEAEANVVCHIKSLSLYYHDDVYDIGLD